MQQLLGRHRVVVETLIIVAVLVGIREVLWRLGVTGMSPSPLASSIVAGGVFVMGLVVAGTLSDYRDARTGADRPRRRCVLDPARVRIETRDMGKPDMVALRERLIAVVTTLRADINTRTTRDCQTAIEELSTSFLELEGSDVPAN